MFPLGSKANNPPTIAPEAANTYVNILATMCVKKLKTKAIIVDSRSVPSTIVTAKAKLSILELCLTFGAVMLRANHFTFRVYSYTAASKKPVVFFFWHM